MTELSLAARNLLAQDAGIKALVAKSQSWDTWIFDENPVGSKIENTSKCLIVLWEGDPWTAPNPHNTMTFPTLVVDIWADPTRNADKSIKKFDAKNKIEDIHKLVRAHFHTVDMATPQGTPFIWGTASEIASRTGLVVAASQLLSGPSYSPVRDSEGSWMGRYTYGVNVP